MNRTTVDRSSAGKSSIHQCASAMLGVKKDLCGRNALFYTCAYRVVKLDMALRIRTGYCMNMTRLCSPVKKCQRFSLKIRCRTGARAAFRPDGSRAE